MMQPGWTLHSDVLQGLRGAIDDCLDFQAARQ